MFFAAVFTLLQSPQPLSIHRAFAGSDPLSIVDSSTSYTLLVAPHQRASLLGALDSPLPPHTQLKIRLGSSFVPLETAFQELMHSQETLENKPITYEFTASAQAGILPPTLKTVIFTVVETSR